METMRYRMRPSKRAGGRASRPVFAVVALLVGFGLAACSGSGEEDAGSAADAADRTEAPAEALMDPNEASAEELRELPGLPAPAAEMIIDGRPFADMVALDTALAEHLGEEARQELYGQMWIPLSLNEATDREILLIPGVGDRMLGEFREYRPYRSMEQFRREIGKYVTDEDLARLELYVRLGG